MEEERAKIIEKGKRMLREYLNKAAGESMSRKNKRQLFKLIEERYRARMESPEYFDRVSAFVNRRKPAAEKDRFCFEMVSEIVREDDIRLAYAGRYPDEYTVF